MFIFHRQLLFNNTNNFLDSKSLIHFLRNLWENGDMDILCIFAPYVLYVPFGPMDPTCPTCPRAQVYFTDRKIKKWKLCTHTFLRVLSLILDLNFRNYRSIQTGWLTLFSRTDRRKIPNRVSLLQQTYFLQQ